MGYHRTGKRNTVKRAGAAFAAVLVWLLVFLVPAFGQTAREALPPEAPEEAATVQIPCEPSASCRFLQNTACRDIPAASDETDSSRFTAGNAQTSHKTSPRPRLSAFMENLGLSHLFVNPSSAAFFADKEAGTSSLFIIHYLHDQDGLKG